MILLKNRFFIFNYFLYYLQVKYNNLKLFFKGFLNTLYVNILNKKVLNIKNLRPKFFKIFIELTNGWLIYLTLNGLGFKATRKIFFSKKNYWRFNVGHSHIFQYFTPKNIFLKVKLRNIYIFGLKKAQIFDITQNLQKFHKPDIYKGVGIKYPYEVIKLKKGKVRQ